MKIFILISLSFSSIASASDLPSWIVKGPMSDSAYHYVVCSHDGIDPEEARQIAESKCLASAAKLGGVNVQLSQKTVQSLTGVDSSETAEILPIKTIVNCEWTDRFIQDIKGGFRVWLRCRISKLELIQTQKTSEKQTEATKLPLTFIEATFIISTVPKADRIIVIGRLGPRVLESVSSVENVIVKTGDIEIEIFKSGYQRSTIEIPKELRHGSKIEKTVFLDRL